MSKELLFAILAASIIGFGHVTYIREMRRGTVQPQRATWTVIEIITLASLANQLAVDPGKALVAWVAVTITGSIVFVYSMRKGVGGFATSDLLIIGLATAGIALWIITGDEKLSILVTPPCILLAMIPTFRKTFKNPESESSIQWLSSCVGAALIVASVDEFVFDAVIIPLTWVFVNGLNSLLTFRTNFRLDSHTTD